jgi:hypothetical protein
MNSTEIENKRVEKLKEINETREKINLLYEEKYQLEKRLVEISEGIRQGKHLLAVKKTDAEILQSEYWKARQ